jgi:hypothetical protein
MAAFSHHRGDASAVVPLLEGILRYPEEEPYRVYAEALGQKAEKKVLLEVMPLRFLGSTFSAPGESSQTCRNTPSMPLSLFFQDLWQARLEITDK